MALAIRSFTDAEGLKLSNLAITSAPQPDCNGRRLRRTRGVSPIRPVISEAMAMAAESEPEDRLNQTTKDAEGRCTVLILITAEVGGVMTQRT